MNIVVECSLSYVFANDCSFKNYEIEQFQGSHVTTAKRSIIA